MKNILIIDDEIDIAESLGVVLEAEGFRTRLASNGSEAFAQLDLSLPDLIILDVMMPKLKGPDVVRIIREEKGLTKLPIILISASHEPKPINETQWSVFMRKPFDLDELLMEIHKLLT